MSRSLICLSCAITVNFVDIHVGGSVNENNCSDLLSSKSVGEKFTWRSEFQGLFFEWESSHVSAKIWGGLQRRICA